MAINSLSQDSAEPLSGCTITAHCGFVDGRLCYDGCPPFQDQCYSYDYVSGQKSATEASLAFNIIGCIVLLVALLSILIKALKDSIGKFIKWLIVISGICALIALIAFVAGSQKTGYCLDGASISWTTVFDIIIAVFCFVAAFLIHKEYGDSGPSGYEKM